VKHYTGNSYTDCQSIVIKGKEIPLHAWTGPEDSRRLRIQYFMIIGVWRW